MSQPQSSCQSLSYQQLRQDWQAFTQQLDQLMIKLGLSELSLACDHAALRVNDLALAQTLVAEFKQQGEIISDNIINGRPIYIIKLKQPLIWQQQAIYCVELPFPSDKVYPQQGWEHVELILPNAAHLQDCQSLGEHLLNLQPQLATVLAGESEIKVKQSSPKGEHERLANPTIAFKLQNICIKVHGHHIEAIIASETL